MKNCLVCPQQEPMAKIWQHCQKMDLVCTTRRPGYGHYKKEPCHVM